MGLDLGEEGREEWAETQAVGQGLYLTGNVFNSPEEDATTKWMASGAPCNEQLERQKPPGWGDGVPEMRHLLGERHCWTQGWGCAGIERFVLREPGG